MLKSSSESFKNKIEKRGTIYFHIGTMKTGTTALQTFLYHNRDKLLERGFYIPLTGTKEEWSSAYCVQIQHAIKKANNPEWNYFNVERSYEELKFKLLQELSGVPNEMNLILSNEAFTTMHRKDIKLLLKMFPPGYEYRAICYVRRQDNYFESTINQSVKHPNLRNRLLSIQGHIDEIPKHNRLVYTNLVRETWESAIGDGRFTFVVYDREQLIQGNVVNDFLFEVGINPDGLDIGSSDENQRIIDRDALEFKSLLNVSEELSIEELDRYVILKDYKGYRPISDYPILDRNARLELLRLVERNNTIIKPYTRGEFTNNLPRTPWRKYRGLTKNAVRRILEYIKSRDEDLYTHAKSLQCIKRFDRRWQKVLFGRSI